MQKKLFINAGSAIVQVLFTALLYFFLYKYLLNTLGIKQLGVWSLILSFSSIANFANLGLTSGLVKFVADYLAENKVLKIGALIFTALIALSSLFLVASIVIFFLSKYLLHFVIEEPFLDIALAIVPYSLGSLCINTLSGVFTSTLEGFQKNYLRNLLYIFSGIVFFVGVVILTPIFELKGVAMAQLIQACFVLLGAFSLTNKISKYNRLSHWKWSKSSLKELFNYGYKFQIVSIAQLLCEPCTKFLLSKFGGLAFLGHYEMASRLVNQFRALLVNANQVVIPVVAHTAKTKTKDDLRDFFKKMNQLLLMLTIPLSTTLLIATPLISFIWIGYYDMDFIFITILLTIFMMFNVLNGPSYFSCLAEGHLSILVIAHVSMAVINLGLGYLLGVFFGGYGVTFAWGIALIVSSISVIRSYTKKISTNYIKNFSKNDYLLILLSILIIILGFCIFMLRENLPPLMQIVTYIIVLALYIPMLMRYDFIKNLYFKTLQKFHYK